MTIYRIIQVFVPVILISSLGFVYSKFRRAEPQLISDIIIYLSIPALFFISFYSHEVLLMEMPGTILTVAAVMILTGLLIWIIRRFWDLPPMLYVTSLFMNSSFVGFPIMLLAYGSEGLSRAIAYDFINGLLIFTLGIYLASRRKDFFELFKMPFVYAAVSGMLLRAANIDIPEMLYRPIEMLGNITIPLALLMLGFRLGQIKIKSFTLPLISSVLRMGLGAVVAYLIVYLTKMEPAFGSALVVMSALPSAFMGLVLAERYHQDEDFTASAIALSTLLAVIFLPLLIWFLK